MMSRFLICISTCVCALPFVNNSPNDATGNNAGQLYSFPPNNTPVTKVYVFGTPVYVRQPFVLPQRDFVYGQNYETSTLRDQRMLSVEPSKIVNENVGKSPLRDEPKQQFVVDSDPERYHLPERPLRSINYQPTPPQPSYVLPKPNYPLPQCYTNKSGFMCCSPQLEQVMQDVLDELLADKRWHSCNVQKIANALQNRTQSVFKTDFEALAGLGDFASKAHFYSDLICKIEVEGRYMLSYATPNRHFKPLTYPTIRVEDTESSTIAYI